MITMLAFVIAAFSATAQEHEHHHDKKEAPAKVPAAPPSNISDAKSAASIKDIVDHYLHLKNALVADNGKEAAAAGTALETAFKNFDKKGLTAEQLKVYQDVEEDAMEHAEHIGANGSKIEHQREHFVILSTDIYDLVKAFGSPNPLYKFFCPMANDGKGAMWLSAAKGVKNPYMGKKMPTCGSMKEELK